MPSRRLRRSTQASTACVAPTVATLREAGIDPLKPEPENTPEKETEAVLFSGGGGVNDEIEAASRRCAEDAVRLLEASFMAMLLETITGPAVLDRTAQQNPDDLPISYTYHLVD